MASSSLSRERILEAAVDLADASGLDALSMRKLGEAVGVKAMSLYNHVKNKDDILDGMVDVVIREIEIPQPEDGWREGMRRRAHSARAAFRRHPWALMLLESRENPGMAQIRYYDAVLGCLRQDGFSLPAAAHALAVLDAFLFGFALQETTLPIENGTDVREMAGRLNEALPLDEVPWFAEMTTTHVMQPDYAYANEFEFGLELILDGLADHREPA